MSQTLLAIIGIMAVAVVSAQTVNFNFDGVLAHTVSTGPPCRWCDELQATMATQHAGDLPADCTVLTQADFDDGSVIISEANTCWTLGEDIVFNPNPNDNWMPRADQPQYQTQAFVLGFFAAIVVQAPGVLIDLGGHSLTQSVEHYVQQRFYAHIEAGERPFIRGQGPANFGDEPLIPSHQLTVRNGHLGLSSHHGIHGNDANAVLLEDLTIADYEVAAVSLNGVQNVLVQRVKAMGTLPVVPLSGRYSSARFHDMFFVRLLARDDIVAAYSEKVQKLREARDQMLVEMDLALNDILANGVIDGEAHPAAFHAFANENADNAMNGNSYGFLFNHKGVAVDEFACLVEDNKRQRLNNVLVQDCEVLNTVAAIHETIALDCFGVAPPGPSGQPIPAIQKGPAGAILQIKFDTDASGMYLPNCMTDALLAYADIVDEMVRDSFLPARELKAFQGTMHVHEDVIEWAYENNPQVLFDRISSGQWRYVRNADVMFHVNKGVLGIRVDGGNNVAIRNTVVDNVDNHGDISGLEPLWGETEEMAYYRDSKDGGHPLQGSQLGYMGADTRGIGLSSTHNAVLENVTVRGVSSKHALSIGLDLFNNVEDVQLHQVVIEDVSALVGENRLRAVGPKMPRAVGLRIVDGEQTPDMSTTSIINVNSPFVGLACTFAEENDNVGECIAHADDFNSYA